MSTDVDAGRRRFLTTSASVVGGVAAIGMAVPFVAAWQPSERARAIGAPVEVDISKLEPGQMLTQKWRGKPVWIVRRPPEVLEALPGLDERSTRRNALPRVWPKPRSSGSSVIRARRSLLRSTLTLVGRSMSAKFMDMDRITSYFEYNSTIRFSLMSADR